MSEPKPRLTPALVIHGGVTEVPLVAAPFAIGCAPDSDLRLVRVSYDHARLERPEGLHGAWAVVSKKGVFLNGMRVEAWPLFDGDTITIAGTRIDFRDTTPRDVRRREAGRRWGRGADVRRRLVATRPDAGPIPADASGKALKLALPGVGMSLAPDALAALAAAVERAHALAGAAIEAELQAHLYELFACRITEIPRGPEWSLSPAFPCTFPPSGDGRVAYYLYLDKPRREEIWSQVLARIEVDPRGSAEPCVEPLRTCMAPGPRDAGVAASRSRCDDERAVLERAAAVEAALLDLARGGDVDPWRRAWIQVFYLTWADCFPVPAGEIRERHPEFFAWFEDEAIDAPGGEGPGP